MTGTGKLHQQAGFSLVEMLVSLALVSLMALYAMNALSSLRTSERVTQEMAAQDEVDVVSEFLRQELSGMRLYRDPLDLQNSALGFDGKPNSVRFVTAGDRRREVGGLYLVTYSINGQGQLVTTRKILSGHSQFEQQTILLQDVVSLNFTYMASDGAVSSSWGDATQLPNAIAVDARFSDFDRRTWSKLVIPLRLVN